MLVTIRNLAQEFLLTAYFMENYKNIDFNIIIIMNLVFQKISDFQNDIINIFWQH